MKKFNVTVNGKSYVVEVEEVGVANVAAPAAAPKAAPAPVAAPKAAPAPAAAPAAPKAAAPVPAGGNIFKLLVNVGDTVKNGQAVVILEAMKMENEIFAPCDGTVKEVRVAQGATVQPGEVLLVIG